MFYWNFIDIFLILFLLVIIVLYVVCESYFNSVIEVIGENLDIFYGFLIVVFYDDYIVYFLCLIVFIFMF